MSGVNKAIILGRLGKDPEVRYTSGGDAVCNFTVATSSKSKDGSKEFTEWHRIVVWGRQGENCGKYLSKGREVYLEGSISTREWEDREGNKRWTTEIRAHRVQFIGGASGGSGGSGAGGGSRGGNGGGWGDTPPSSPPVGAISDDDIPF